MDNCKFKLKRKAVCFSNERLNEEGVKDVEIFALNGKLYVFWRDENPDTDVCIEGGETPQGSIFREYEEIK